MSKRTKKKKCWSSSCGDYGNTVRVGERKRDGIIYVFWFDSNKELRKRSLGHRDKARARQQAREFAESLSIDQGLAPVDLTLGALIDIYVTKGMVLAKATHVSDTKRQLARWREFLGSEMLVRAINPSDVNAFLKWRKANAAKDLSQTTLWHDWKALDRAMNFAVAERDQLGRPLLENNHLKGRVKVSKSVSPTRPVASDDRYRALWGVRKQLPWQFEVALCLTHETGHRINAVLSIRWTDVCFERSNNAPHGSILWRAESDKVKNEHRLPVSPAAREALEYAKLMTKDADGFVFCAAKSSAQLERRLASRWLRKAESLAGLSHVCGGGWHALRRKWATDRQHLPDAAVAAAGGWKDTKTMKQCYQHANDEMIAAAIFNIAA